MNYYLLAAYVVLCLLTFRMGARFALYVDRDPLKSAIGWGCFAAILAPFAFFCILLDKDNAKVSPITRWLYRTRATRKSFALKPLRFFVMSVIGKDPNT
jgi:hypothetical protein